MGRLGSARVLFSAVKLAIRDLFCVQGILRYLRGIASSKTVFCVRNFVMVPNLYSNGLDTALLAQAEADPFGSVTLWTYFNNCLAEVLHNSASSRLSDNEIQETCGSDLVYGSFLVYAATVETDMSKGNVHFIKLLNRCVISSFDIVEGAAFIMQEDTGISAFDTPSILQILMAVSIKHHNDDVLRHLASHTAPNRSIFTVAYPSVISKLKQSNISSSTWDALVASGWILVADKPQSPSEGTHWQSWRHYSGNATPQGQTFEVPGEKLRSCVKELPSNELRCLFPSIPRSLYDGIPPHHKWPGDPVLVKLASARSGRDGLEVLKLLVEIGGMDVNDSKTWWKAGDYDPREWNPKCRDGTDCMETPLHIAVEKANLLSIEYLLTHGAKKLQDAYGRNQLDRALLLGNEEVVALFRSYGW